MRMLTVRYGRAEAVFTQQNKSQVSNIFFLHPVVYSTQEFIQKIATARHTFIAPENLSVFETLLRASTKNQQLSLINSHDLCYKLE